MRLSLALVCCVLVACVSTPVGDESEVSEATVEPDPVLGPATPEEVLARAPGWVDELVLAQPDEGSAHRLASPVSGIEVEVFFGSWCSDSRRELTRLWRALEMVGGSAGFPVRYIGVDRSKEEPEELVAGREIHYVPTLIVLRDGAEVGRIVESAPGGVEVDLADLVEGRATGWISGREDLEPRPAADDSR